MVGSPVSSKLFRIIIVLPRLIYAEIINAKKLNEKRFKIIYVCFLDISYCFQEISYM